MSLQKVQMNLSSITAHSSYNDVIHTHDTIVSLQETLTALTNLSFKHASTAPLGRQNIATIVATINKPNMVWENEIDNDPDFYLMVGEIGFSEKTSLLKIIDDLEKYITNCISRQKS